MNYKQKLGYMALGAVIMALGIIIGQWGTPDIEAQSNGVFDKITCREIEVIDKDGNEAIRLYTTKHGGDIRMESKDGRIAAMGIDERGGYVFLTGKGKGLDKGKVSISTDEDGASIDVGDRVFPDAGISMFATDGIARIDVEVEDGGDATMYANVHKGVVAVFGKDRGSAEMLTDEDGGRITVSKPDVAAAYGSKIIWSAP